MPADRFYREPDRHQIPTGPVERSIYEDEDPEDAGLGLDGGYVSRPWPVVVFLLGLMALVGWIVWVIWGN